MGLAALWGEDNDRHYVARCLACCESANLAGFCGVRGGSHGVSSRDHHNLSYLRYSL